MLKATIIGGMAAALLATACGGGSRGGAPAAYSPGQASPASAEPGMAPGAPAGGALDAEKAEAAPSPERPGLGTEWGENRDSRVSTAPFFRENPDKPFDVVKLFYNDRDGVRAMAERAGVNNLGEGSGLTTRGALTVRLLDGGGRPLEGFSSGGNNYVVGDAGDRYVIQLKNNTGVRFEAVTTVDGLDVVNGHEGAFSNRGYIVNPWSTVEIDGWRRSTDTVAAFRFGRVSQSYAGKKGNDRNVGVIGVAFFEERGAQFPWTHQEVDQRHNADPFPGQFAKPPNE
jgi:hypothetical protein